MRESLPADVSHPLFGRVYARMSRRMEPEGLGALRDELLADLSGRVVEVGAGNGLNLAHSPAAVQEVVAVEPEPYLRGVATEAARAAPVPATGRAERLPLPDASVDAAVLCLVMCSLPDLAASLAEVRRVLRPGGTARVPRRDGVAAGRGRLPHRPMVNSASSRPSKRTPARLLLCLRSWCRPSRS